MSGSGRERRASEGETERLERARLVMIGKAIQFGSTVVGSLVLFLGGGIWLDRRLGTQPLLLLIGLLLAFVAIGYNLYDLARVGATQRGARPSGAPASRAPPRKSWDEWDEEERERDDDEYTKERER